MKKTAYYVAVTYVVLAPTIVSPKFENRDDANAYAAIMCRANQREYIVLEVIEKYPYVCPQDRRNDAE